MIEGKNIVVTGASDGIGLRLASLLAGEGGNVVGTGRREKQALPDAWPKSARYFISDQSKPKFGPALKQYLADLGWGSVDYLVLNAGVGLAIEPSLESAENITQTLHTNLIGPLLTAHALYPLLADAETRACLTLIGSTAHKGNPLIASYAASKAGLHAMARSLSEEWRDKIDVQIIHPGPTATDMHRKAGMDTGFAGRFFVDPGYSAGKIRQHMLRRTSKANVSFSARGRDLMKSLIGKGV